MAEYSETIRMYFSEIDSDLEACYAVASEARSKGFDPEDKPDIPLAKNMSERVEGLISAVKPEIIGSGLARRIEELEDEHGELSLEVAMVIAHEVSEGKFCKFGEKLEAIEVGIKTGFAYLTIGIVSAPLEGFTNLKSKMRRDGKPYFSAMFSGPVRGAGGTAISLCMVMIDYVRKKHGYGSYDPDSEEVARMVVEMEDYHERVTNLQYRPSSEEIEFLIKNCPIEIDGDPTEKLEVSQHKDLPRVSTDRIRGGVALVVSMLALKAPKLIKEIKRANEKFDVGWGFMEDFIKIQVKKKSLSGKPEKAEESKITPDYTFISDLVAGRPVLTYPLRIGGFRLRYGKTRMSGYSAAAINPATMAVLDKYVATGTQLKVERPGKAAAITPCDSIDGPIVKLKDGSVVRLDTEQQARDNSEITEVLYLGDILISYGDFHDRNHKLVPSGYCEEWHALEIEAASRDEESKKLAEAYLSIEFPNFPRASEAMSISKKLGVPLHPRYTYFWNAVFFKRSGVSYVLVKEGNGQRRQARFAV